MMGVNTRNMQSCLQKCNKLNKSHLVGLLLNSIALNKCSVMYFGNILWIVRYPADFVTQLHQQSSTIRRRFSCHTPNNTLHAGFKDVCIEVVRKVKVNWLCPETGKVAFFACKLACPCIFGKKKSLLFSSYPITNQCLRFLQTVSPRVLARELFCVAPEHGDFHTK